MLFPTPRYGAEAITTLISRANGSVMLIPSTPFPVVSEILAKKPMRAYDFPLVEHFLSARPMPYPFTKTFESNRHEPLVCLHTSGTTGFPKPIIWTHDWANSIAAGHYIPAPPGYERIDEMLLGPQRRMMTLFPQFHASGIICALFFQLYLGTTVLYAPAAPTPNEAVDAAADALEVLSEEAKIHSLALPPPHAEYLGADTTQLERVSKKVDTLLWGGGDLSHASGSAIAARMQILNQLASTELGLWAELRRTEPSSAEVLEDDWHYVTFDKSLNIRFDPVSEGKEGTIYEAIMVKNKGEGAWVQPMFKIYTDMEEITLGDLFTQHPYDSEKWRHSGRSDDLLNFLTSETFHPGAAERRIATHPGVAEVIMVGTRRPKASLLIRLNNGTDLNSVWEVVDEVNQDSPLYARVGKHMILAITEPFPKTAKGTIQKKATIDLYASELDALYVEDGSYVPTR